jgi:hypothetical protein
MDLKIPIPLPVDVGHSHSHTGKNLPFLLLLAHRRHLPRCPGRPHNQSGTEGRFASLLIKTRSCCGLLRIAVIETAVSEQVSIRVGPSMAVENDPKL